MRCPFEISASILGFRHAVSGIVVLLKSEHNARVHALASVAVVALGMWLGLEASEWCWIVLAMVSVWMAEALNTAVEFLADVVSPEFHPGVKKAKDVAAASVLIAAIGAVAIGFFVFLPRLQNLRI